MITALMVFMLMYAGMLLLPKYRVCFALTGAVAMLLPGIIDWGQISGAINRNVIMMISGTMGIVTLFIENRYARANG